MKFILGKKIEMTQIFKDDGEVIPVTVVKAGPCVVTAVKTKEKEKYDGIQIGFDIRKNPKKPEVGRVKKIVEVLKTCPRYFKEFRVEDPKLHVGDFITAAVFQKGDAVEVTGTSKGRGFAGVVKRHGFHCQPSTHGHKDQLRMPGSSGATAPQRVIKGKRMGGRMGGDRVTVKNLKVVDVNIDKDLLYIKGAVPGARNSLVIISGEGEMQLKNIFEKPVEEKKIAIEQPKVEQPVTEGQPEKIESLATSH